MKIIAMYLPQFHDIPENDEWWGKGFTEWRNVKKAKPIYEGHVQPKVPLDNNYYNLLDDETKKWQVELAKKYGIYGFAYYHYWFNGRMLLEKPMEQMLLNPEIDLPFCICWANEPWTKTWVGNEKKVLISQKYGSKKEWKEHFDYLLPFFKDKRYITIDGAPLFIFYRPSAIECIGEMIKYWKELAQEAKLGTIKFAYYTGDLDWDNLPQKQFFDYDIESQPGYAEKAIQKHGERAIIKKLKRIRRGISRMVETKFGIDLLRYGANIADKVQGTQFEDYDVIWGQIIRSKPLSEKSIPGAFVHWDNTARYGSRAKIIKNDSPQKFKMYMSKLIVNTRDIYKKDMIFMYAWNEWAEGGMLEPDEVNKYKYLEAIHDALEENGEFPKGE